MEFISNLFGRRSSVGNNSPGGDQFVTVKTPKGKMARQAKVNCQPPFLLSRLPEVPLDKVLEFLTADDLRRFHQVNTEWKRALESRPRVNRRRLQLVAEITANKENIQNSTEPVTPQESLPPAMIPLRRERTGIEMADSKKQENPLVLMECTNQVTPTSFNTTVVSTPADVNNFLTPTSHFEFQDFQKAEQSLEQGQKLVRCSKCRGPVVSPATPLVVSFHESQEQRRVSSQAARCKLFSSEADTQSQQCPLDSPRKRDPKKARTQSAFDLSPIPYSPTVTVSSLEAKMRQCFAASSPCLTTSVTGNTTPASSPAIQRSSSYASINGIDLPAALEATSPIELSFNSTLDNSSFFNASLNQHQCGTSNLDLNGLNCSRSCCSPRRVQNNSHLYASQYSDSGLSCEGDSIDEYCNMILSPVGQKAAMRSSNNFDNSQFNCSIERVREFNSNQSDGAFSVSSFGQLQRSDHNISTESVFQCVLECPNPTCGYRFCSTCEQNEHPGRPCRLLSSDQFETSVLDNNNSTSWSALHENSHSSNKSNTSVSKKANSSTSSSKSMKTKSHKKTPLRRLARL